MATWHSEVNEVVKLKYVKNGEVISEVVYGNN